MSIIQSIISVGSSGPLFPYWISSLSLTSGTSIFSGGVSAIPTGGVIVSGGTNQSGSNVGGLIVALDEFGRVTSQKVFGGNSTAQATWFSSVFFESPNIGFLCGREGPTFSQVDSAGSIAWSRRLTTSNAQINSSKTINSFSQGIYVAGTVDQGSFTSAAIFKFNGSGTLQWQRALNGTAISGSGVTVDSVGNVTMAGFISPANPSQKTLVWLRLTSTGDTAQQYNIISTGSKIFTGDTVSIAGTVSFSGETYLAANGVFNGTPGTYIFSLDFDITWQRFIQNFTCSSNCLTVDTDGTIIIIGVSSSSPNSVSTVVFNKNGDIVWCRELSYSNGSPIGSPTSVSSSAFGGFYTIQTGQSSQIITAKLPKDGSLTGNYGPYSYTTASPSVVTPDFFVTPMSFTTYESSFSFSSESPSVVDPDLSKSLTPVD